MLRKVCRVCGSGMIRRSSPGGAGFFCEQCSDFTEYDELDMEAHCPDCGTPITVFTCCSQGFFCSSCRAPKSSRKVVWKTGETPGNS